MSPLNWLLPRFLVSLANDVTSQSCLKDELAKIIGYSEFMCTFQQQQKQEQHEEKNEQLEQQQ